MKESKDPLAWLFQTPKLIVLSAGMLASGLLAFLFTSAMFVRPLYQSEALIYVPLTIFSAQYAQQGIGFGSDHEISGHIQILRSNVLLDSLISIFILEEGENFNDLSPQDISRLYNELNSKITVSKNRYHSVSVRVRDYNPLLAAGIANTIVRLGDEVKGNMLEENRLVALNFAKEQYLAKQNELEQKEKHIQMLLPAKRNLPAPGMIEALYLLELDELVKRKNYYEMLLKSMENPLPKSYIVSPAVASYDIVWPRRWLVSFASAFGFLVFFIFFQILKQDAA
jgi:capsular polysaccharide biosynthesis protein